MTKRSIRSSRSAACSISTRSHATSKSSSSSSPPPGEMDSLLRLPTADLADRINAMLDVERRPCYRCRDYLRDACTSSSSAASASAASSRRSSSGRRTRRRERPPSSAASSSGAAAASAVGPDARAKIVQWLYDCVDYLELSRECVALAASYVDRFMSSALDGGVDDGTCDGASSSSRDRPGGHHHRRLAAEARRDAGSYQLLAVAALLVAAKSVDGHGASSATDADVLARVSHGSYDPDEILATERVLLDALEWRLCGPTAAAVAGHLVALLSRRTSSSGSGRRGDDDGRIDSVADFARLQIELSVADYGTSASRRPSEVALAAVLNSVDLLDFSPREVRSFGRVLRDLTGIDVRSSSIAAARDDLHRVFDRQSEDVMGRAAAAAEETSDRAGGDGSVTTSGRSPADVEFVTPRSSMSSARRNKRRGRRARPSPKCVGGVGFDTRKKLEP